MKQPTDSPRIVIVPIGSVNPLMLGFLALTLPDALNVPCSVQHYPVDVSQAHSVVRQQYNSTELLAQLLKLNNHQNAKILGVTDLDLFIPIFTFVFGEAQLDGPAALISTHRLRQQFYGLPDDEALLFERCEKEALHELGHAFGLAHCHSFECVMHRSNSIEQVDLKPNSFCPACHRFVPQARQTPRSLGNYTQQR